MQPPFSLCHICYVASYVIYKSEVCSFLENFAPENLKFVFLFKLTEWVRFCGLHFCPTSISVFVLWRIFMSFLKHEDLVNPFVCNLEIKSIFSHKHSNSLLEQSDALICQAAFPNLLS